MKTFYIDIDRPELSSKFKSELQSRGFVESTKMPVDFMHVYGEAGYNHNLFNTKKSKLVNLITGKSKNIIKNKLNLSERFADYDFIPKSIRIESATDIPKFNKLKIMKPTAGYAGAGICIVQNSEEAKQCLNSQYREYILQDYIQNPATVQGYKFHLRIMLILLLEPYSLFVANKHHIVTAKKKYIKDDWSNSAIHDTHYYARTNLSFFPETLPDDWKTPGQSINKINEIFRIIFSKEKEFKPDWNAKNGYYIFGADVMFDGRKPILLEINSAPTFNLNLLFLTSALPTILIDRKEHPDFTQVI